jgi:uncharacterized protein YdhG (YjbR/CyaY superfamily)
MPTPRNHDEYLAALPDAQRRVLQALRQTIREVAPTAEETISYQICAFRDGVMLVGYGATAKHCAFFLMSNQTTKTHAADLQGYDLSTGTIRFQPDQPLPTALVQKLVRARQAENATRLAAKAKPASRQAAQKSPATASDRPAATARQVPTSSAGVKKAAAKTSRDAGQTPKPATTPMATKKATKKSAKAAKKSGAPKSAVRQRAAGKTKPGT